MSWDEIKKGVNSDLNVPLNEGGVKIVKSIQRGTVSLSAESSITVNINEINTQKSIVLLDGGMTGYTGAGGGTTIIPWVGNLTSSKLVITIGTSNAAAYYASKISYEIIEFY